MMEAVMNHHSIHDVGVTHYTTWFIITVDVNMLAFMSFVEICSSHILTPYSI